ncbi:MAG: glycosyltransferase family 1 protein, partial [Flavobacteriaceae bacterium]|nr:glycosyltransferase family 1 protein [Flavobacteriaceae bacterium]
MKLVVVSSAPIVILNNKKFMYAPYHKEMKIWAKYVDEIQFCCPIWKEDRGLLIDEISFPTEPIIPLKEFDITRISKIPKAFLLSLANVLILFKAMYKADHIHLRCPGNMTLLAAIVQVLFPRKTKTAKYAGNWDPKAKQPFTYKLQRWILSNTFLTRNMQVLVYGEWPNQT